MPTNVNGQERELSPEEKELVKQSNIAKLEKEIAEHKRDTETAKKALETSELDILKSKAEAEKAIANANKAKIEAERSLFKSPEDLTLPTGDITTTGDYIESLILSQNSLKSSCETLSGNILDNSVFKGKTLTFLYYEKNEVEKLKLYTSFIAELDSFKDAMENTNIEAGKLLKESANVISGDFYTLSATGLITAGYAIHGILETAAAIVATFKTTTTYTNIDITIEQEFLISAFIESLQKENEGTGGTNTISIYAPSLFPIVKNAGIKSSLIEKLTKIQDEEKKATQLIKKISNEIVELKSKIKEIKDANKDKIKDKDKEQIERIADYIDQLESMSSYLELMINSFKEIRANLYKTDDVTKISTLAAFIQSEKIYTLLNKDDSYLVLLKVVSKGSNKVNKGWWKQTSLEHSAGTKLTCLISDISGKIFFAKTISNYQDYTKTVTANN